MFKKSLFAFFAMAVSCAVFIGCTVQSAATDETVQPTVATPTPQPKEGIEAVFDKQISISVISSGEETDCALFLEGAKVEAQSLGVTLNIEDEVDGGQDAIIACVMETSADDVLDRVPEEQMPVCVFGMQKGNVPSGVSYIYYNAAGEIDVAFEAALTYPPHDTPVRLILMFESKETKAYAKYAQLYAEGKIFPKEIYIASEAEDTLEVWLTDKLDNYIEGMLDGIFAENTDLANCAFDALHALERADIEVFGIGFSPSTVERMSADPEVFPRAAGANTYLAGKLCVRACLNMIKGEDAVTLELTSSLFNAKNIADGLDGALAYTDLERAGLFEKDWMIALREYYEQ